MVQKAAEEAAVKGPEMLMRFKVKKGTKAQATLFLRYLDNGSYWPLLTVTDLEGRELLLGYQDSGGGTVTAGWIAR